MPPAQQVAALLQTASPKEGHAIMERVGCTACHSIAKGGPAIVGPDLYGVVGRPVASVPGFDYSAALKKHHGPWTYAELFEWIKDPAAYAPGTKMTFAGLPDAKQRADVISFLRTLSPHPEPLPPAPGGATRRLRRQGSAPAAPHRPAPRRRPRRCGAAGRAGPDAPTPAKP